MEYLNKIELQGYINNVSFTEIYGIRVARFSIATQYAYTGPKGASLVDTTWFECQAWEDKNDLSCLQSGNWLHVIGRMKERRFVDHSGIEKRIYEVICQEIELIRNWYERD